MLHNTRMFRVVMLATALAAAPAVTAFSQQAASGTPMVKGSVVRDFARITFYWPERVSSFNATTSGNKLTLQFDRAVNPNFGEILRSLHPYVTKAELSANQRSIVLTLNNSYKTRSFITDSETGVDILGLSKTARTPTTPETPEPAAQVAEAPAKPAEKPAVAQAAKPAEKVPEKIVLPWKNPPVPTDRPAPPAPVQPVAQTPTVEATAAPVVQVEEKPVVVAPVPVPAPAPEVAAPVPAEPAAPVVTPVAPVAPPPQSQKPAIPLPAAPTESAARLLKNEQTLPITGDTMVIKLSTVNKQPVISFPFSDRVAAATWIRGRSAWILFNKPRALAGLKELQDNSKGWLYSAKQYGSPEYTLLRLDMFTDFYVRTEKDAENYTWNVIISSSPTAPHDVVKVELGEDKGNTTAFMAEQEAAGPYTIYDSLRNDRLQIVPLYASSRGVSPERSFVQFELPATLQGIVVNPLADGINVRRDERGITIGMDQGIAVTPELKKTDPDGMMQGDVKNHLFKPSFFPYRLWAVKDDKDFDNKEAFYLNQATSATNMLEKNQWRQKLAELYFGQGMMNETLGVLGAIRRDDSNYFRENKLAALESASHLMNYRVPEATVSVSSNMLDNMEETDLLRKTIAAAGSTNTEPVPYMAYNDTYIRQYPPGLRKRMAIIAANQALAQRDFKTPQEIFTSLEEDDMTDGIEGYIAFMRGQVAAEMGRTKEAQRIWKELADNVEDRQFRARAEFARTVLALKEEKIKPEEALAKIDKLRIIWRGDDLERSVLNVVGQLNTNLGNYWDGMKAWEELMQYYPNTQESADAYKRLAETFRMLYLEGGAKQMEPVKALALYNEFQELTPIGKDGNAMVQQLVDVLVSIDLLDQATARLKNLVEFRLQGEEKSRAGARLAVINLLNRKPEDAISALQMSRVDDVPAALSLERNRIAAKALIDLKHYDQALTMIDGDYSKEGEAVRLEAYTKKEDWAYVVDILENILRSRPDLNAPFTDEEGHQLVQLVLGYIFLGENDQLKYLRDAYLPLMEKNKYRPEFAFFTQDTKAINRQDFDKFSSSINNMQGFMDNYRQKVQSEGLSEAVGGKAPPAAAGQEPLKAPANPQ